MFNDEYIHIYIFVYTYLYYVVYFIILYIQFSLCFPYFRRYIPIKMMFKYLNKIMEQIKLILFRAKIIYNL